MSAEVLTRTAECERTVEQGQRCVPMEQCHHALDTVRFHVSKDIVVVRNALLVHWSLSEGNDAGPADREAVRWDA